MFDTVAHAHYFVSRGSVKRVFTLIKQNLKIWVTNPRVVRDVYHEFVHVIVRVCLFTNERMSALLLLLYSVDQNVNLALFQPAWQSSDYPNNNVEPNRSASLAVDGNYDPNAYNIHCSHTNDLPGGPNWLVVDLGLPFYIDRVVVCNRDSYGEIWSTCT